MTSPILLVLSLALVCSTIGLTSQQAANHNSRPKTKINLTDYDLNMESHWTNKINKKYINKNLDEVKPKNTNKGVDIQTRNLDYHKSIIQMRNTRIRNFDPSSVEVKSRVRRDKKDIRCESFKLEEKESLITHPHPKNTANNYYYNNSDCITKINATSNDQVIQLTFIDVFSIEYHPECAYDYLEIRDGFYGYANLMGRFCGQSFPRTLKTKGPNVWLKFHSDETIEYEGFKINVEFKDGPSHYIPESCYKLFNVSWGTIDTEEIDPSCKSNIHQALDVLWTIKVPVGMKIYLNFTQYALAKPNECNKNIIQVFETEHQELDYNLAEYCGSIAQSTNTVHQNGNVMYVRLYLAKDARKDSSFRATFNAYRKLDGDDKCSESEFDCEDSTCINPALVCDNVAHCRLKADEDKTLCTRTTKPIIYETNILVIVIIFSLILSGMTFVFIFKCAWKLYKENKIIKEHIRQSCEDRLENLMGSRLTLDTKRLQGESKPRASLERENHNNEMGKKQRSFSSKHKQSSIESDYQETHLDLDEEIWRREVDSMPIEEDVSIERTGKTRKSDLSKKEESMRSRTKENENIKEENEYREHNREIRDVSAPDTMESGCQTRESLYQTDPPPSSAGSGNNSRGLSTFGYSGATIVKPSHPATTNTSEITIELLKQPSHQESKPQNKISDRRPISTETTRSAPDVIIVAKPIRLG